MITLSLLIQPHHLQDAFTRDEMYKSVLGLENPDHLSEWRHRGLFFYEVLDKKESIGVVALRQFSSHYAEFHGGLYKEYRNQDTPAKLKQVIKYLKNMGVMYLMTTVNPS